MSAISQVLKERKIKTVPVPVRETMSLDITVKYSKQDLARLQPILSNWLKTHSYIRQLDIDEASLLELRKMIAIETDTYARNHLVTRLYSRFSKIRKQLEDELIFSKVNA